MLVVCSLLMLFLNVRSSRLARVDTKISLKKRLKTEALRAIKLDIRSFYATQAPLEAAFLSYIVKNHACNTKADSNPNRNTVEVLLDNTRTRKRSRKSASKSI